MTTRLFVKAQTRLQDLVRDHRESGQGTLEYLGIVIIVVLLVGAAVTAFTTFDLGAKLTEQLGKIGQGS